jgi:hypothetical protein
VAAERSVGVVLRASRLGASGRDAVRLLPLPFGPGAVGLAELEESLDPSWPSEAALALVNSPRGFASSLLVSRCSLGPSHPL